MINSNGDFAGSSLGTKNFNDFPGNGTGTLYSRLYT